MIADPNAPDDPPEADPARLIPLAAARAALLHWWREPIAGLLSLGVGVWDAWHYGRDGGLSSNVDEILILGGVILIAGSRRLFPMPPSATAKE